MSYGSDDFWKEEYKILVDYVKHQHDRFQDYSKTFFAANTFLLSVFFIILKVDSSGNWGIDSSSIKIFVAIACLCGAIASLSWFCTLLRINKDARIRFFQLRQIE